MSKRKVMAGGYKESSDESDIEAPTDNEQLTKKPKAAPYAPPRLIVPSRSSSSAFQLPSSVASSVSSRYTSSLLGQPTVAPETVQTARSTPDLQILQTADLRSSTPFVLSRASSVAPRDSVKSKPDLLVPHTQANTRSTLALERQLNTLGDAFEEYKSAGNKRHQLIDNKLDRILNAVSHLKSASNVNVPAPNAPLSYALAPTEVQRPYLSNPTATPELVSIISKVVSEARSRIGKKKGGADDNSCKEHARQTFYRMLGIGAAREIRPFFEDEYGEPDTLPAQFIDPDTQYCRPYPHWKTPLTKQVAWIPTFVLRFRTTIPSDQSDVSNMLRSLSDEQIVVLLNDGPFKSGQAAWRDMKKSDTEVETMRSNSRRYQRLDRKAEIRASYIRSIPSLQAPEWEYLSQAGYMSQDESDEEGGLVTKRPENRSQWETNLYEAIHAAERKRARAKPGLCPRLPPCRVELVKRPLPQLERGTGNSRFVVRIAACGISASWRRRNQEDFQKYIHLVNMKITTKPDIDSFLAENPMLENNATNNNENADRRLCEEHEADLISGSGVGEGEPGLFDDWKDENYEEEESGAILDIMEVQGGLAVFGIPAVVDKQDVSDFVEGLNTETENAIVIDPLLLDKENRDCNSQLTREIALQPEPDTSFGSSKLTSTDATYPPAALVSHIHDMPPPPLIDECSAQTTGQATADHDSLPRAVKRTRSNPAPAAAPDTGGPKKRGRPSGSKNKKKAAV